MRVKQLSGIYIYLSGLDQLLRKAAGSMKGNTYYSIQPTGRNCTGYHFLLYLSRNICGFCKLTAD